MYGQEQRVEYRKRAGGGGRTVEVAVALDEDDAVARGEVLGEMGGTVHAAVAAAAHDDVADVVGRVCSGRIAASAARERNTHAGA